MSAYSDAVLALSPNRYYRLGETSGTTAVDAAGASNGTYTNSPTLNQTGPLNGDSDPAVLFDGTNDYVACGSAVAATTEVCLMGWYKRGASNADSRQVIAANGSSNYWLWVSFNSGTLNLSGEYTGFPELSASVDLSSGWHFLVGQRTAAGDFELYVDGVLEAQAAKGAASSASGNLEIGRGFGGFWTRGYIDEVAVWDNALDAADIADLYDIGINGGGADTFTATAAVTRSNSTASGAAGFVQPFFEATAAVTRGASTASGAATNTAPTYTASAAPSRAATTASGAATFEAPVYTASAAPSRAATTGGGSATFFMPTFTGTAAVARNATTASGAATFEVPVYTGSAAVTRSATRAVARSSAAASDGNGGSGFSLPPGRPPAVAPYDTVRLRGGRR